MASRSSWDASDSEAESSNSEPLDSSDEMSLYWSESSVRISPSEVCGGSDVAGVDVIVVLRDRVRASEVQVARREETGVSGVLSVMDVAWLAVRLRAA